MSRRGWAHRLLNSVAIPLTLVILAVLYLGFAYWSRPELFSSGGQVGKLGQWDQPYQAVWSPPRVGAPELHHVDGDLRLRGRSMVGINTIADEREANLSGTGEFLVFVSNRGENQDYDLFWSRREGSQYGPPQLFPEGVNSPFNERSPSLSWDAENEEFIMLFSSNRLHGSVVDHDLYFSRGRFGESWTTPQRIFSLSTIADERGATIHPDGRSVFFTRPGRSGMEIHESWQLPDDSWSESLVVAVVSHPDNDPWLRLGPEGGRLWFSRDGVFWESQLSFLRRLPRPPMISGPGWVLLLAALLLLLLRLLARRWPGLELVYRCLLLSALLHLLLWLWLRDREVDMRSAPLWAPEEGESVPIELTDDLFLSQKPQVTTQVARGDQVSARAAAVEYSEDTLRPETNARPQPEMATEAVQLASMPTQETTSNPEFASRQVESLEAFEQAPRPSRSVSETAAAEWVQAPATEAATVSERSTSSARSELTTTQTAAAAPPTASAGRTPIQESQPEAWSAVAVATDAQAQPSRERVDQRERIDTAAPARASLERQVTETEVVLYAAEGNTSGQQRSESTVRPTSAAQADSSTLAYDAGASRQARTVTSEAGEVVNVPRISPSSPSTPRPQRSEAARSATGSPEVVVTRQVAPAPGERESLQDSPGVASNSQSERDLAMGRVAATRKGDKYTQRRTRQAVRESEAAASDRSNWAHSSATDRRSVAPTPDSTPRVAHVDAPGLPARATTNLTGAPELAGATASEADSNPAQPAERTPELVSARSGARTPVSTPQLGSSQADPKASAAPPESELVRVARPTPSSAPVPERAAHRQGFSPNAPLARSVAATSDDTAADADFAGEPQAPQGAPSERSDVRPTRRFASGDPRIRPAQPRRLSAPLPGPRQAPVTAALPKRAPREELRSSRRGRAEATQLAVPDLRRVPSSVGADSASSPRDVILVEEKQLRERPLQVPRVVARRALPSPVSLERGDQPLALVELAVVALPSVERNWTVPRREVAAATLPNTTEVLWTAARFGPRKQEALKRHGGTAETESAVSKGLAYLASRQRSHGGFGEIEERDKKYGEVVVGRTGLALLAFLGAGHYPGSETTYDVETTHAIRFLIEQQVRNGHFGSATSSYGHGIATYALGEAYLLSRQDWIREPLEAGVRHILNKQIAGTGDARLDGGWNYYYATRRQLETTSYPRVSVTAWQVMALKTARLAGLDVPHQRLELARSFLLKSWSDRYERMLYTREPSRLRSRFPTLPGSTPAAAFALQILGTARSERSLELSINMIDQHRPDGWWEADAPDFINRADGNPYFWYYGTLALFLHGGAAWERWNEALQETLLPSQRRDGSWVPISVYANYARDTDDDACYTTALNVLMLEVYYRYLTPFQENVEGGARGK